MKKSIITAASMLLAATENTSLTFNVYNADENSFDVNSTLVMGEIKW
ncbi:hypothetical protein VR7878_02593 [Vibrio ruber DSM 16370]|uniref:Uncharacterized protein n=1 Tax=Vibrio ruber (strain DSM 16370 / JCM 11486 / BCRC 17186 / CECT 7878 / LMG 23124 / VR1) TaxID=1123498 RepID=A0A1R4LNS4_VIBR1|nr:hypothetical protein VR7878_02593 [Vibrio ruber DSM 16370]